MTDRRGDIERSRRPSTVVPDALQDGLVDAEERGRLLAMLVQRRKEIGMTQVAVAAEMRTTQSNVSDIECGELDCRLSTLQRYARAVSSSLQFSLVFPETGEISSSPWPTIETPTKDTGAFTWTGSPSDTSVLEMWEVPTQDSSFPDLP